MHEEVENYIDEEPTTLDLETPQEFLPGLDKARLDWIWNGILENFDQDGELLEQGLHSNAFNIGLRKFIKEEDDYWHESVEEEIYDIQKSLETGSEDFQVSPTVTAAVLKKEVPVLAKSTATKLLKYFVTKEGLKISAKTAAKAIAKLSGTLMSPYLVPLIWAPEIIDIATSKDIQKVWKNIKDENWWKEAIERDKEMRAEARKGKMPRLFSTAPHGEYFHRDVGWY
jgi:hypothetical protein